MNTNRVTAFALAEMKSRGEKISALTAYDYPTGRLIDAAGVDVALVGDSLGMVVLGYETTLQVTMEDMVRHTAAVARGVRRALVVADMPFMSYQASEEDAIRNAGRLVRDGGAQVVKLEGGTRVAHTISRMTEIGIPVMGHVGLTPQSVHQLGYRTQGTDLESAERIKRDAQTLEQAGVCAVVLEKIPSELAADITRALRIPTIGIGAGPHCDGQVLVTHDVLGLYDRFVPPFAKRYANLWQVALEAFRAFNREVKEGAFPPRIAQ